MRRARERRESGDAGELARGASADDGDIISVSCLLTSSAVTPCDNLEGDVNTLPAGVLKFVLDVTRGLSSWRLRLVSVSTCMGDTDIQLYASSHPNARQ